MLSQGQDNAHSQSGMFESAEAAEAWDNQPNVAPTTIHIRFDPIASLGASHCQYCGVVILRNEYTTHFLKYHSTNLVDTLPCQICGRLFVPEMLTAHVRLAHAEYYCPPQTPRHHNVPNKKLKQRLEVGAIEDVPNVQFAGKGECKECRICLEQYQLGETVTYLGCMHCFHRDCLIRAAEESPRCPLCLGALRSSHN